MPQYWNFRWSKGVRRVPYYHITVHEEVGDECAHEQPIADRCCLQHRGASTPASSKVTRDLPKMESWMPAGLEFSFRPTSELLLDVVAEDGGAACSARERNSWERWASGRVAETSWRKNKSCGDSELGWV
jgi:hypothetical protein